MAKNLVTGCTAEEGVFAALLAQRGVSAPETPIEGPRGLGRLVSEDASFAPLTDNIGRDWELLQNAYKPFPCGIVIHAPITAALEVERVPVSAITAVRMQVNPLCLELCGRREPKNAIEGTFSVYHWVAVSLVNREIGIRHYSDETVRDPAIVALRDRVTATANAGYRKDEAEIELVLRDGKSIRHHVDHAIGAIERPPSDGDLEKKLLDLAGVRLGPERAKSLARACWALPEASDAKSVVDAACPR
jgi:2-methylcitrate dehydratase PrpD